ncbi:unnamed protein product, partial [Ectocarpus sp. 4 AP-2014]
GGAVLGWKSGYRRRSGVVESYRESADEVDHCWLEAAGFDEPWLCARSTLRPKPARQSKYFVSFFFFSSSCVKTSLTVFELQYLRCMQQYPCLIPPPVASIA